jgi:hypothetical protein
MVTKATTVKKTTAKKPAANKTAAQKPAAQKPAANKTATKKPATRKAAAKKPAAPRSTAKVVRHGTVNRTQAKAASNGSGIGVDREALLKKLVKLSNSKQDAVALDATKALLTYVK